MKIVKIINILIFMIFLSLSFIGLSLGMTSKIDNTEWRRMAEFPKINSKMKFSQFPGRFEQFYKDNFGFRNILLRFYGTITFELFKKSPVEAIIRTEKDWYFHNEARVSRNYKGYYDYILFSEKQLETMSNYFLSEKKWLEEKNIHYLFVVVPDKEVIYSEYYPYPNNINANIQLQQILGSLEKKGVEPLFLGPQIKEAKGLTDIPIYYRQDSHWNSLGAFFGYQAVMERLKDFFPDMEILQLSDFDVVINSKELEKGYDLHRLKSLISNELIEPTIDINLKEGVKPKKIGKVILYADSFFLGDPHRDYLGGSAYFLRYNFPDIIVDNSHQGFNREEVEKEQPVLVIRETIQRSLSKYTSTVGALKEPGP